ncbi:uncharacterized protein KY384_004590 [Bacidia gigantensis]|uniref:uncharacterized protein n=1 Tax=Bacidia gigantensis TaxID=2732470 RepID=UPI001D051444|nr:uncharacterized protein KY384_004590 [Bacidia gigantensis]KAG8531232.1 hypothetical protein KY384_004590 [Bacidia gigantensis]
MDGGTHMAKISSTLAHLQTLPPTHDDDLILMIDAYDIWFQLPPSVLISRYFSINAHANKRLSSRLGATAIRGESISQTIIFGAGKRCAPNQIHTIACYPIPDSPLPDDLYFANTDTDLGQSEHYFHKQRWLNSGSIMGPVGDLRRLFTRAEELMKALPRKDPEDNGSQGSADSYHGSDQSVFARIWGEQEFQREGIRRRYGGDPKAVMNPGTLARVKGEGEGFFSRITGGGAGGAKDVAKVEAAATDHAQEKPSKSMSKGKGTAGGRGRRKGGQRRVEKRGAGNIDALRPYDILNPPFTHESAELLDGHPMEFGIGVDYFADLTHQTINSEKDARWLVHGKDLEGQIGGEGGRKGRGGTGGRGGAGHEARWDSQSLYTHLCLGVVPVMVHHNGDKDARQRDWARPWWARHMKGVVDRELGGGVVGEVGTWREHVEEPLVGKGGAWGGAWTARREGHKFVGFEELCPVEWDGELFGEAA